MFAVSNLKDQGSVSTAWYAYEVATSFTVRGAGLHASKCPLCPYRACQDQ